MHQKSEFSTVFGAGEDSAPKVSLGRNGDLLSSCLLPGIEDKLFGCLMIGNTLDGLGGGPTDDLSQCAWEDSVVWKREKPVNLCLKFL